MIDPPEQFGKYELLERLAIGGMAEIFKAKSSGLGGFEKLLAIKRLHPRYSEDDDFVRMLVDEAKIAVELNHQNICQIFDLGRCNDQVYIAMEYLDGRDLYQLLKRQAELGRLMPIEVAVFIATEICTGLDYAHRKKTSSGADLNIIHRDISPQNIIVTWEGEVKIVDFGIAKASLRAIETASGVIKGKFYYMSPEQARGDSVDARTDIFSMGIVLYELLTGTVMYGGDNDVTLLSRVRRADISPPTMIRDDIPLELERIVMKALARDRSRRYQSAHQMRMALTSFLYSLGKPFSRVQLGAFARDLFERRQVHNDLDLAGNYHGQLLDREEFMSQFSEMETSLLNRDAMGGDADQTYRLDPQVMRDAMVEAELQMRHDLHNEGFLSDDEFFEGEDTAFSFMGDVSREEPGFQNRVHADGVYTGDVVPFEEEDTIATDGLGSDTRNQIRVPSPGPQPPGPPPSPDLHRPGARSSSSSLSALPPSGDPSDGFHTGVRTGIYSEPTHVTRMRARQARAESERSSDSPSTAALPAISPVPTPPPQPAIGGLLATDNPRTLILIGMAVTFLLGCVLSVAGIILVSSLTGSDPEPQTVVMGRGDDAPEATATPPADPDAGAAAAPRAVTSRLTVRLKDGPGSANITLGDATMRGNFATFTDLAIGANYDLTVEAPGYKPYKAPIAVPTNDPLDLEIDLEPRLFTLRLITFPSGATITLNGEVLDAPTPTHVSKLPCPEPLEIKLTLDKHETHSQTISWSDGDGSLKTVEVNLEALKDAVASDDEQEEGDGDEVAARDDEEKEEAEGDDDAATKVAAVARKEPKSRDEIERDREALERRRAERERRKAERERKRAERRERKQREREKREKRNAVTKTPDRSAPSGVGQFGYLSVNAKPWGQVYVDGRRVARETPLHKWKAPAGYRLVKVVFPSLGGLSRKKTVNVKPGTVTPVFFTP